VRACLLGAGLSEATLTTFVPLDDLRAIGYEGPLVRVRNPMTSDQAQLRPSLLPGLLRAAQRNWNHGVRDVRLFELGKAFGAWEASEELPEETERAAVLVSGATTSHWSLERRQADVYDVKGVIELLLQEIGVGEWETRADAGMPFHPGRSGVILIGGTEVGRFGEVRPSVTHAFDLEGAVAAEVWLERLFEHARRDLTFVPLPTHPPVLRDISMWLPEDVTASGVAATMRNAGGELLESVEVIDEYRSPEGRRSVAFSLSFRAPDRTLRAAEADDLRGVIAEACAREHGAEIR
jgi:phenylalanyl-tRNA synthetase beta chain